VSPGHSVDTNGRYADVLIQQGHRQSCNPAVVQPTRPARQSEGPGLVLLLLVRWLASVTCPDSSLAS